MTAFSSTLDLEKRMILILRQVIENVSEIVIELFRKDYLKKIVYDSHGRNKFYHNYSRVPTMEFYNSWEWSDIKMDVGKTISRKMYNNHENMSADSNTWKHGSNIEGWPTDGREWLKEWLNKKGFSSSINLSVYRPKAYWDEFYKDFIENGNLDKIIESELKKFGVVKSQAGGLHGI